MSSSSKERASSGDSACRLDDGENGLCEPMVAAAESKVTIDCSSSSGDATAEGLTSARDMNSLTFRFGVASTSSTTCSITGFDADRLNDGNRIDRFRIAGTAEFNGYNYDIRQES